MNSLIAVDGSTAQADWLETELLNNEVYGYAAKKIIRHGDRIALETNDFGLVLMNLKQNGYTTFFECAEKPPLGVVKGSDLLLCGMILGIQYERGEYP